MHAPAYALSTRNAASNGHSINESHARLLLIRTAHGDRESFAVLYDYFGAETYAVCAHHIADQPRLDNAMMALWQAVWTDAASLSKRPGAVRDILVLTAHGRAGAAAEVVVAGVVAAGVVEAGVVTAGVVAA